MAVNSEFIKYVGDTDIHDGKVATASHENGDFVVHVTATTGRTIRIRFIDCHGVVANRAVGMILYALAEMKTEPPWRRFVFANWDDDDDAALEIVAKDIRIDTPP
jgi:hypothetical protein